MPVLRRQPSRMERAAEAQRLRDSGLTWREVGKRMGISLTTAHDYASDPTGEKAHARRHKNHGTCKGCGCKTWSGGARELPDRCRRCASDHQREMSRRWIVESFAEWNELFGVPPSATDWSPAQARYKGIAWKADRHAATGRPWPQPSLVINCFGSWNAGVIAAGFAPMAPEDSPWGRAGAALRMDEEAA